MTITESEIISLTVSTVREYDAKQASIQAKQRKDNRLRNTKLLLENYNYFHAHADKSIYSSEQLESIDELGDISDYKPHMLIESIKKSSYKTYIMLAHIDKMLKIYEIYAKQEGDKQARAFNVLKRYYVDKEKINDIAAAEGISERTAQYDLQEGIKMLAGFIFGFDILEDDNV
jgi:hypothetical protein